MIPRYTLDGGPALEARLDHACAAVLRGLQTAVPGPRLEAVLLGGGYGRGEGGVLRDEAREAPYNDLEFYVCLRGNRWLNERRWGSALRELAHRLTPEAGIEVELKLFSLGQLRRAPVSMFYYDLVMGHRWVLGQERLLRGCEHHRHAGRIPLAEATRLLMNRVTGLLLARARLERNPCSADDADFAGRNLAKAQLALGDALLTALGRYHWSCLERRRRLEAVSGDWSWLDAVRRHHVEGVAFKLHPRRAEADSAALTEKLDEVTATSLQLWLWLESRRLRDAFASAREYARCPRDLCPETNPWRNWLIHLQRFGWASCLRPRALRHPRERVLRALALLLWEPRSLADPADRRWLLQVLDTRAEAWPELLSAYEALWRRFS